MNEETLSINETSLFVQNDAHQRADNFASPEIYMRADFEGETIDILFAK